MNTESVKHELIDWISHIKDYSILKKIVQLKNSLSRANEPNPKQREFNDGKHIFTYVADDFNEPLEDFKEYME